MKILFNLAPYLIGAYTIRLLITGASVGDSITTISLASLYAFFLFLESKKEAPVNKQCWDRIVELEDKQKTQQETISALSVKNAFFGKR